MCLLGGRTHLGEIGCGSHENQRNLRVASPLLANDMTGRWGSQVDSRLHPHRTRTGSVRILVSVDKVSTQ